MASKTDFMNRAVRVAHGDANISKVLKTSRAAGVPVIVVFKATDLDNDDFSCSWYCGWLVESELMTIDVSLVVEHKMQFHIIDDVAYFVNLDSPTLTDEMIEVALDHARQKNMVVASIVED